MENLTRQQTEETPEINFDMEGLLLIKGVSIHENVKTFYMPVFEWLDDFEEALPATVTLVFDIEYLNTSSRKTLVEIAKRICLYRQKDSVVNIIWRYEKNDEDNYELGKDIEYLVGEEFMFIYD